MKKLAAAVAFSLAAAACVQHAAAIEGDVKWTAHNLSKNFPGSDYRHYVSNNETQVCVFCHTPHNAATTTPLWNKQLPTQTFKFYTSSPTLSAAAKAVTVPGLESLVCLSCHDGKTAINVQHSVTGRGNKTAVPGETVLDLGGSYAQKTMKIYDFTSPSGPTYGANIGHKGGDNATIADGNHLEDDHPISFSYTAAVSENTDNSLRDITVPTGAPYSLKFFGPENRIECSTCHDPHVDYGYIKNDPTGSPSANTALRPFLRTSNSQSKMCLACHNK